MKISKHIACIVSTLLLTMAQTAWATSISTINVGGTDYTLFTGFTATDGTNDGYGNMVDGDTSTSFHVFASNAFVEFNTDEPIIPKGYIFNTYMDEYFFPTSWVLKAKVETSDEWTTLSTGSGGTTSGTEFTRSCDNNENNSYKYFRFEVTRSGYGNNDNIWLTEIRLYGNEYIYYTHLTVTPATCTATGIKQECYKRSDGKYFTDETGATELAESDVIEPMIAHTGVHHEAGDGNIEYWQCSMCSKYFTDAACTQEVTADEVLKTVFGTLTAGTNGASGYYTLESKTYTLTADVNTNGYIYVPEGVTATIDLNGHTIDRGLTSAVTNGMVIRVAGSLTVTDSGTGGKIKGGMDSSADHVSCVKVYSDNGSPTFTLQGGTLIGNTSHQYKCAVYASNSSNITISGGKITGDVYGIVSSGHVTVTGGEISGNTYGIWSKNYSISVSGNPVITNNTDANVKLYSDGASVLTIAGELTDGANIGITKGGVRPTDNAPVTVTSGYGTYNSNVSPSTYFSLDNNGQIQIGDDPYNPQYMTVVMGWNEDKTEIAVGTALYTVNFDMNGHGDAIDAVSLLSGYKLMKPEPTADGWFFSGWYTDDACTSQWNFNNAVTSNMTLHALWTQGQIYRVTLPEKMVIVSTTNALVGGKYPTGTNIRFKVAPDYVVDGDVKNGEDVLTADGDGIYTVTVADADITITATVKKAAEPNKTLSGSESYTANDGDVLTGSTSGTVTIPTGASITLSDVTISGGIVCNGTATITLVGTNSVTGFSRFDSNINAYRYTAGIQVGGSGTTLTIKGNGSLTANGALHSAGIGLSRAWDVDATGGHILIEGGNITATGNGKGAGIGTGACFGDTSDKTATLGNITIKGGTVRAIGGTDNGNGIGKGHAYSYGHAVVGTITIYDGINLVDASSISESVTYMHVENETETNVTESKADYFTIIENGNRRIIVQKVTPTIADVPDQTYTGSEITPEPLVIAGSLNLTKDEDYTYSYENNTNVGTATVRATFQGTYASLGYVEKTFTIVPSTIMVSVAGGGTVTIGDKSASDGEAFGVMSEKG
ncbi:MAG: InlB B-repeat-containing protein, partial [Muribaculaceae bacterium]|nr:InlB B-repeat-containing protein [Muribaculaceae bacterium]